QEIKPRKNELIRPQIANVTQAIIVTSATQPDFSSLLLDRFLALMESEFIKPYIVITKIDLATKQQLTEIEYFKAAYENLGRSEEHTSELQSRFDLVCRLLLEKKNQNLEKTK